MPPLREPAPRAGERMQPPEEAVLPAGEAAVDYKKAKDRFERAYLQRMIEAAKGNISEAARRTGIHRKSLEYLLRKLDIRAKS